MPECVPLVRGATLAVFAGVLGAFATLGATHAADPQLNLAPTGSTGWLAQDDEFIAPASGASSRVR